VVFVRRPSAVSANVAAVNIDRLPEDFAAALAATVDERGVFGARLTYYTEATSTNDLASAAAERGEPEGTTIVAGTQTAGRGRLGRAWFSPPGAGLYMSTIVRRASLAPWLTLAGGVAVAEGIARATALPVQIKWPNDIVAVDGAGFRARRKIAGILAEASSGGDGVQHVVLGVGVNVRSAAFPPDLADRASAIETELGRPVEAGEVVAQILAALNLVLTELWTAGPPPLVARWLALSPSAHGASIEWDDSSGPQRGTTAGLAGDGALLARTAGGLARIIAGEVRWL
jgi:BirA family transcriptional regulator, biotin operon repressor / biotin---[acetyl-CoA-carboxylase] ligase